MNSRARRILVAAMAVAAVVGLTGCEALKQALGLVPPATPTGLTVVEDNIDQSMAVSWDATEDADEYLLESSTDDGATFSEVYTGTATNFSVTGITLGQLYYFRVSAINEHGTSEPSALEEGVIAAAPPPS